MPEGRKLEYSKISSSLWMCNVRGNVVRRAIVYVHVKFNVANYSAVRAEARALGLP